MIRPATSEAYNLLHFGALALARAEQQGICIDVDYCARQILELGSRQKELIEQIRDTKLGRYFERAYGAKNNVYSDTQLRHILYDVIDAKPYKETKNEQYAVDEEALLSIDVPGLDLLLQARKLAKIESYLSGYLREQVNGVLHPFFDLNIARTYRPNSSHPNFQNVPVRDEEAMKITRGAFIPRPGHVILEVDVSGIEVRIGSCYHKDPMMLTYIKDKTTDMHRDMACQLFFLEGLYNKSIEGHKTLRKATKNGFVFPEFYGDYWGNCAMYLACQWGKLPRDRQWKQQDGIQFEDDKYLGEWMLKNRMRSLDDYADHVKKIETEFWEHRFKVYQRWKDDWYTAYERTGYFDMLTGFRCSGVMSYKQTSNYPVQGSAFHCCLWAFIEADRIQWEENWDSRLIGQIHDSIVVDAHPDEVVHVADTIQQIICHDLPNAWKWIIVPMEVEAEVTEIDEPWSEKKPMELAPF